MSQERAAMTVKEKEFKLERDKQDIHEADKEISRLVRRQRGAAPPPPPVSFLVQIILAVKMNVEIFVLKFQNLFLIIFVK